MRAECRFIYSRYVRSRVRVEEGEGKAHRSLTSHALSFVRCIPPFLSSLSCSLHTHTLSLSLTLPTAPLSPLCTGLPLPASTSALVSTPLSPFNPSALLLLPALEREKEQGREKKERICAPHALHISLSLSLSNHPSLPLSQPSRKKANRQADSRELCSVRPSPRNLRLSLPLALRGSSLSALFCPAHNIPRSSVPHSPTFFPFLCGAQPLFFRSFCSVSSLHISLSNRRIIAANTTTTTTRFFVICLCPLSHHSRPTHGFLHLSPHRYTANVCFAMPLSPP